jgi:hypothetical protein
MVNLRRLEGDALSTPYFQEVATRLDDMSRQYGYKGAKPSDLITFAEDLRKIYPDTIPSAGFQGGIRTAIKPGALDLLEKTLSVGKLTEKDQQRALRELLKSLDEPAQVKAPQTQVKSQSVSSPKSTTRKVLDAILPGDTPNKEGGFIAIGGKRYPDAKTVAELMDGKDYMILDKYADLLQGGKDVPIEFGMKAEELLDIMRVDTREPKELVEWIRTVLGKKMTNMKKLKVN